MPGGRAEVSLVRRLRCDLPGVRIAGNALEYPGFGRLQICGLTLDPQRINLTLLDAKLRSPHWEADLTLGGGTIESRLPVSEAPRPESGDDEDEELPVTMDEENLELVIQELRNWTSSHPRPDEPFLFFLGSSMTPREFFGEVVSQRPFGRGFLRFLEREARRVDEPPWKAVARAVEANR
jgi:hypothetical protein